MPTTKQEHFALGFFRSNILSGEEICPAETNQENPEDAKIPGIISANTSPALRIMNLPPFM